MHGRRPAGRARYQQLSPNLTPLRRVLKAGLLLAAVAAIAVATPPAQENGLRGRLERLVSSGQTAEAVRLVQSELQAHPDDPGVRREYVDLHMTLARAWLDQRMFAECRAALDAVRRAEPRHAGAAALQNALASASADAPGRIGDVDRLLRLELFDAALDLAREIVALRPDLSAALRPRERAAWLGAADDHYLARNFNESFALYEKLLTLDPGAGADVHSRWAVSLALALGESADDPPLSQDAAGRLLARAIDVLRRTNEPVLGQIIGGLCAERGGQLVEAGRAYAQALGVAFELPAAEQRKPAVARLRRDALERARGLYDAIRPHRRDGAWAAALGDVWKQKRSAHFDVFARSELIAERVADALEHHLPRVEEWLGAAAGRGAPPRCEVRVYRDLDELERATGATGAARAVTHTKLRGAEIVSRTMNVYQADPWLLAGTLPHELVHVVVAERFASLHDAPATQEAVARRSVEPADATARPRLALDEGLAIQVEPAARRLQYRRLLDAPRPALATLLAAERIDGDEGAFYARSAALVELLLKRGTTRDVLALAAAPPDDTWTAAFGWESASAAAGDWRRHCDSARRPPRMPLMILTEPSAEHRKSKER
ncbi:MAG: hypothetical protein CHACPFDD_03031 [Phycisphaerae bacterium]|nr:hypothetical protein [Phycisphaerae bacterium]